MKPAPLFTVAVAAASIGAACDDTETLSKEEFVAELLDDREATLAAGVELVKAAAGGDTAAMATLESDDPVAEADRRVRHYGMTVCGGEG